MCVCLYFIHIWLEELFFMYPLERIFNKYREWGEGVINIFFTSKKQNHKWFLNRPIDNDDDGDDDDHDGDGDGDYD